MIEGYEEKVSVQLAGRIIILAESKDAAEPLPYMVCECRWDNPLNIEEYRNAAVTADYLEAMNEYAQRISGLVGVLEAERKARALPAQMLGVADCVPGGLSENMDGKIIVIKPEVLSPEYRSADHQLGLCKGGNGARPDARGRAVFFQNLYSGKTSRYERQDIAGVMDMDKLPAWAREKLAALGAAQKSSVLSSLDAAKKQAAQQKPGLAPKKSEPAL